MSHTVFCATAMLLTLVSCSPKLTGDLLIRNVNVVDVIDGVVLEDRNILITGERITHIGKSNRLSASGEVDGSGQYCIPGLWDMHTHNFWDRHYSGYYVANGVVGVRNMYTPLYLVQPLRDSISQGLIPGPHYVAAGRVVEGVGPTFPDWLVVKSTSDVSLVLDTLQMEGSDFVKVYNKITPTVYFELTRQARQRGMEVHGHLPMQVNALEASEAGHRSFEHLLGIPELCTADIVNKDRYGSNWLRAVLEADEYATLKLDAAVAAPNLDVLRKNGTHVCPTLTVLYNYTHSRNIFENEAPASKFPSDVIGYWTAAMTELRGRSDGYLDTLRMKYNTFRSTVKMLYDMDVPLLIGTDAINPFVYPGYSIHKELGLMRECGIPDKDILRMATWNAAKFLHLEEDFGTVDTGKLASLVLLRSNPLVNVSACQDIQAVVLKGKWMDRKSLDRLLNEP